MAGHALHKLSDRAIRSKSTPGRYADGGNLYFQVQPGGSRSFMFMKQFEGRRLSLGLGSFPETSLADARKKAANLRQEIVEGDLPRLLAGGSKLSEALQTQERRQAEQGQLPQPKDYTFSTFAVEWMNKNLVHLSSEKVRKNWYSTIERYAKPISEMSLTDIQTSDILACLNPIWQSKPETGRRVQGRIERILAAAEVLGYREGKNPAQWRNNLDLVLPNMRYARKHFSAMPYAELPNFIKALRENQSCASRSLQFIILTAARSGEGRGALWQEIDLRNAVWSIPPERMKARKPHRVPLSDSCLAILENLGSGAQEGPVIQAQRPGRPISETAIRNLMTRLGAKAYTIHGFRSSFRDWAGNATEFPRELAEEALAHQLNAVEAAYRRDQAVERRRVVMEAWADFIGGG